MQYLCFSEVSSRVLLWIGYWPLYGYESSQSSPLWGWRQSYSALMLALSWSILVCKYAFTTPPFAHEIVCLPIATFVQWSEMSRDFFSRGLTNLKTPYLALMHACLEDTDNFWWHLYPSAWRGKSKYYNFYIFSFYLFGHLLNNQGEYEIPIWNYGKDFSFYALWSDDFGNVSVACVTGWFISILSLLFSQFSNGGEDTRGASSILLRGLLRAWSHERHDAMKLVCANVIMKTGWCTAYILVAVLPMGLTGNYEKNIA